MNLDRSKIPGSATSPVPRLTTLSPARRRLVDRCRRLRIGVIRDLLLRAAEPVFDPRPRYFRDGKLAGKSAPLAPVSEDFALKAQWVELFALFDQLGDARFEFIEIQDGLPFRYRVEDPDDDSPFQN